jgi:hypothetical protein
MAADKTVGRAEALRQSMVALIERGEPQEAHPAYWAPFVVVGEGNAAELSAKPLATSSIVPGPQPPSASRPCLRNSSASSGVSGGIPPLPGVHVLPARVSAIRVSFERSALVCISTSMPPMPACIQFGAIPLSFNSLRACSFFARCDNPIARSTCGALVNWMLS